MTYYIAHRLFSLHDRALGALVASKLADRVGVPSVFLPFCDTNEDALVSACKGRTLFELDCERLKSLSAMIAILHGPSLDDGVCMEIGYSCCIGAPVAILTTDFQTYGPTVSGPEFEFTDPLIQAITQGIVRHSHLGAKRDEQTLYQEFIERNLRPLENASDRIVDMVLSLSESSRPTMRSSGSIPRSAFIEFTPHCDREKWRDPIVNLLQETGWTATLAKRMKSESGATKSSILSASLEDWYAALNSELLIVDVDGPETPPGAALLIGAAVATGRRVLAKYTSGQYTFAHGREPNFRNLMIQYGIASTFRSVSELRTQLQA